MQTTFKKNVDEIDTSRAWMACSIRRISVTSRSFSANWKTIKVDVAKTLIDITDNRLREHVRFYDRRTGWILVMVILFYAYTLVLCLSRFSKPQTIMHVSKEVESDSKNYIIYLIGLNSWHNLYRFRYNLDERSFMTMFVIFTFNHY